MIEDWLTTTLGESLDLIRNGLSCKQNKTGEGERISRIETISDSNVNPGKVGFALLTDEQKNKYRLFQGDILFSHINSTIHVGKTAYIDDDYDMYHGMNLLLLRPIKEVNPRFFEYYLKSLFRSGYWESRCKRSVNQASVNQQDIKKVPFFYPSLPEQKRIVAILDEAFVGIDRTIENTERNLENARELFDSYLNEVFGERNSNVLTQLSEITTDITDGDHSPPPKAPKGIPFITISNIDKATRQIDFSNTFKVPEDYYNNLKSKRKPTAGDVLYTVTGSFGIPVIVKGDQRFCFQRHIGLLRPQKDTDSSWLYYALMSPLVYQQAEEGATGTAQKTVGLRVLRNIRIPLMNPSEQKAIVKQLDKLSEETQHLKSIYHQKLSSLTELKQSILQKAFTGELTKEIAN